MKFNDLLTLILEDKENAEIDGVAKKDILSGFDKIFSDIDNDKNSKAVRFFFSRLDRFDEEDALSGVIIPKMPPNVYKFNSLPHFYHNVDGIIYSTHPVVLKFYEAKKNRFQGFTPREEENLTINFYILVQKAYKSLFR